MGVPTVCDDQPLPFPILRRIVADSVSLKDVDSAFDTGMVIKKPFLLLPAKKLAVGQPMCVRAIVPPSPPSQQVKNSPYRYLYAPFEKQDAELSEPWWDTMVVSADHQESGASIPLQMRPWSGHRLLRWGRRSKLDDDNVPEWSRRLEESMFERGLWHIYETDVALLDEGQYRIEGRLEYAEGRWNFEKGPVLPYDAQRLAVYPHDTLDVVAMTKNRHYDTAELPLCTRADHLGRWVPADKGMGKQDKQGKVWAPYECQYRPIQYDAFNRCLARKYPRGIDIYGDSNTRRSLKKFVTQGRWCSSEDDMDNNRRACFCEDFNETSWDRTLFDTSARINNLTFVNLPTLGEPSPRSQGVHVRSYKWDGLTYLNEPEWQQAVRSAAVDVVIISLGNWDTAYMTMDEFSAALMELVGLIHQQYLKPYSHKPPRIVYRTPQYYCCRVDHSDRHRRTSGARIQAFDRLARGVFVERFNAIVWDTLILGEARTWEEKIERRKCPANHATADVVEIENQLLMNALCNE
ncbi:hypothetical protein DFQ29_006883 [Apophysomyces sp. BC1021]|nr:hypothetical protein DFQ29_006883 [Apophysomyces sp. BC1021]